jgi:exodeoxyribonuclease V beta subunit
MRFGNCIHEIFEHLDFTNDASIDPLVVQQLRKHGMQSMERATAVADCVRRVLAHPAPALASCPMTRTLRELEFHLPAKLLTPDQLTEFAGAGLAFEPRQGILKGFMDLVFERDGRFHILDWKSNWLGADADAYTPEAMRAEMRRHRYGLQWRLYLVALHRFLRTRLREYDPARHLGEIYYVFLRGIEPARPELGVVRQTPDFAELTRLDALFTTP